LSISLTSQPFDFSGYTGISLDFWHKYATEAGWDFGNVEYSTDGVTWYTVASYDGVQSNWLPVQLPIPGLDGQATGRIRFRFTSDTNTVYDGWHIDDIAINGGGPGCVSLFAPVAGFTTNSPVELGQSVEFTNLTTGTVPMTYTWDFGDGIGTSTETNPAYTYSDIGTYAVTLNAQNPYGTDSITHSVTVEPVVITSVALTQVTTSPIFPGELVGFSADISPNNAGKPYTYTIDFGDGTVITNVSSDDPLTFDHIFTSSGVYTIQIWVENAGMSVPISDSLDVMLAYKIFLPLTTK
jgi:PKD repeat protein